MRQTLSIALLQFRLTLKSKGALFGMFALPLLLTLILGMIITGGDSGQSGAARMPVALIDQDKSLASAMLLEALQSETFLRILRVEPEQLERLIADRKVATGIWIAPGFEHAIQKGQTPEIQIISSPDANLYLAVNPAVRRQAARVATDYRTARRMTASSPKEADIQSAYAKIAEKRRIMGAEVLVEPLGRQEKSDARLEIGERAVGFAVMFVMMMLLTMSGVILQERQMGTWWRLRAAPLPWIHILGGYVLGFFTTGMFQFAILIGASSLLFRIYWGPLLPLSVMAAATVLCATGLGLFLAGIVRTAEQQRVAGSMLTVAASMLGGVFWPLELVGENMRRIGYLTPHAWAMEGFRTVMLRGGAWSSLQRPVIILLGLALLFLGIGIARISATNR